MYKTGILSIVSSLVLAGMAGPALADIKVVDTEANQLSLYGFIKGDATYQDSDMNSKVAPRYAVESGDDGTNLTAMNSRFGMKWNGPMLDNGWNASAVFEFDLFDSSSNNQMKF